MNKTTTARPWKINTSFGNANKAPYLIDNDNAFWVVDNVMSKENAELIVTAVNNHDLLVEACREASKELGNIRIPHKDIASAQALLKVSKILEQALNATQTR
jgi:hypothetical protein